MKPGMARRKLIKVKEFDNGFYEGEGISKYLDLSRASRLGREQKRVSNSR